MPVIDVAARFHMTRHWVYRHSRKRGETDPVFQRIYSSHGRFEITMESIAAYEASLTSINDEHKKAYRPRRPLNFRSGVPA